MRLDEHMRDPPQHVASSPGSDGGEARLPETDRRPCPRSWRQRRFTLLVFII